MKLLKILGRNKKKQIKKTDEYQDVLVAFGKDQFEVLVEKGLNVRGIAL